MRLALIHNPIATAGSPRARVLITLALRAEHDLVVDATTGRGDASRLAQAAASDGADVVVVYGGDGTVNEAVNGLAGSSTALAVVPAGSTNVFARTIGASSDAVTAADEILAAIRRGSIRRIGLGRANDRYFCLHTGVGLDAAVVRMVETRPKAKRYAGHAWYAWAAFRQWSALYDRRRPRFAVRHDDGSHVDDGVFAIVQNSNPYTYLGNRRFDTAPGTGWDSGLHAIVFRRLDLPTTTAALSQALVFHKGVVANPRVVVHADQSEVVVTGHGPVPWQMDGEYLGEVDRVTLTKAPAALDVVVP